VSVLPETLVTRSADGTTLAYHVLGSGPPYLVSPTPMQYGVPEINWDEPGYKRTLTRLASFGRFIMADPRGISERFSASDEVHRGISSRTALSLASRPLPPGPGAPYHRLGAHLAVCGFRHEGRGP
jgi:hypothetical protein